MQTTNSQGGIRTAMRFRTLSPYTGFNKTKAQAAYVTLYSQERMKHDYRNCMKHTCWWLFWLLLWFILCYTLIWQTGCLNMKAYASEAFLLILTPIFHLLYLLLYIQKYIKIITLHQTAFTCVFSKNTFALVIMDGSLIFTVNTLFCLLPLGLFTRERKAEGSRF